jgi:hypothetical protein
MGEITLDPLPIDHQVSSCRLVDFISYSLVAPKHVKAWSLAISYFSFIPVLHCMFCFLLRTMRFWMVSEQCGGNFKATTRFYWVRSEGVDRFVVD